MKPLKTIAFFPFMLVLFFCLHGSVENYGYIDVAEVLMVGLTILIAVTCLLLLVFLFTKDFLFAALISFFICLWYLFFGAIQDWIMSHSFFHFLKRYSVLLPLLLAATVLWIIFVKKKKQLRPRLVLYFNVLLLIYCGVDSCLLLNKYLTAEKKSTVSLAFDASKVRAKPNVYYLLFDEYPGYKSLKDSFGYSNDSLYDFLRNNEFKLLPTFSNYDFTTFSMSSILNMQYVDNHYSPRDLTQRDFQLRINEIRNASVVSLFKSIGYRLKNYSIFDIDNQHGISDQNSFLPVHSVMLTDKILHNRVIRSSFYFLKKFSYWKRKYIYQHDVDNKLAEEGLLESSREADMSPKFCYAHFLMPHGPFYRDSLGRDNPDSLIDDNYLWPKDLFLSYLKYTNTFIRKLVVQIATNDPNAIIVVMSDHGYHHYGVSRPDHPFNFDNICAVRFPDKNYINIKEKWSTVNFFRYLFNCEFGQKMPYLQDSSIVLDN